MGPGLISTSLTNEMRYSTSRSFDRSQVTDEVCPALEHSKTLTHLNCFSEIFVLQ